MCGALPPTLVLHTYESYHVKTYKCAVVTITLVGFTTHGAAIDISGRRVTISYDEH